MDQMEHFDDNPGSPSDSDSDSDSQNDNMETHDFGSMLEAMVKGLPKGKTESSSSSGESDDDMQEDVDLEEMEKQLTLLNDKLADSPNNYDLLVEKIRLLRSCGELEQLRTVREKLSSLYPLSESLWLDWIKDELKLAHTDEERTVIAGLFERAVKDYLSIEVWLEYTKFALSEMHHENGVEHCRSIFERALSSGGIHVVLGSLIWDAYRDFEAAVIGLCADDDSRIEQEKRYTNLCRRQVAVPLCGMDVSFAEDLSTKFKEEEIESIKDKYSAALTKFKTLEPFEEKIAAAKNADEATKVQNYKDYIAFEKQQKSNPARIQCLYERGLAECPLDSSLWIDYIHYVSKSLPIAEIVMSVSERATRNCPWVQDTWFEYFLVAEQYDVDKLVGIFEKAIANCFTINQVGDMWIKYLESLRRILRKKDYPEKDVQIFSSSCAAAERHILSVSETQTEPNDYIFQVAIWNIRLLALRPDGMKQAREAWADLLLRGYGTVFRNWLQFLILEQRYGDDSSYRQQLSKATAYIKDDVQSIASLWLSFERDNGEIHQLQASEKKIMKYLEEQVGAQDPYNNYPPRRQPFKSRDYQGKNKRKFQEDERDGGPPQKNRKANHTDFEKKPKGDYAGAQKNSKVDHVGAPQKTFKPREGVWTCPDDNCAVSNFATRQACFKCHKARPEGLGGPPPKTFVRREGDWTCPDDNCGACNFASRQACYKCKIERPQGLGKPRPKNRQGDHGSDAQQEKVGDADPQENKDLPTTPTGTDTTDSGTFKVPTTMFQRRAPTRMLVRRPQASFIPRSLQVNTSKPNTEEGTGGPPAEGPAPPDSELTSSNSSEKPATMLSNQDFRSKFLGSSSKN